MYGSQIAGSYPLYRYWNNWMGDHFYTLYASEIGTTTPGSYGKYGYVCEGVAGYCLKHQVSGSVPLFRYYNGGNRDHFYTTNSNEIGTTVPGQVGKYGYQSEGIDCYVFH